MPARLERLRTLGFALASAPAGMSAAGSSGLLEGPAGTVLLLLEAAD
jgi:hypothetical protein